MPFYTDNTTNLPNSSQVFGTIFVEREIEL